MMNKYLVRRLVESNFNELLSFLQHYRTTNLTILENLSGEGLINNGRPRQGDYWGVWCNEVLCGVLAHYCNNTVIMQLPDLQAGKQLTTTVLPQLQRPVGVIFGQPQQLEMVVQEWGIPDEYFAVKRQEDLYELDLNHLSLPKHDGELVPIDLEHETLLQSYDWLRGYEREALNTPDNEALTAKTHTRIVHWAERHNGWLLKYNNEYVALAGLSARYQHTVLVGPVWTPPKCRGRGYARLVVGLILQLAHQQGAQQAILFTNNPAARKAYEALGFNKIGYFSLAFLKQTWPT